ncbi:hypothetical protein N0V85_007810 [Neurospora sp. IMI 360204]|nr:hypothetical protein N0V85_007810 [Neurospora sp. IMI 360204]
MALSTLLLWIGLSVGVLASGATKADSKIIVGGGTAGNALATRLSQGLPKAKILVIEAGPAAPDEDAINVPGLKGGNLGGKYDWKFPTVPQVALKNRTTVVNRGKVLGGSSAINLLSWNRAAAVEYDQWEKVGNPGWNWKSMSAAMTKAENYTGGPPGSGTKGPVHASVSRYVPEHQKLFVPTVTGALGIAENNSSLQGNPIGVMFQPSSVNPTNYVRSYSANAYLPQAGPNLEFLANTLVAKVNLKKEIRTGNTYQATGVTLANGTVILASQEVILSAGAIQTPNLLERSGIGRASVLRAANITQLVDLPGVSENYNDHLRLQLVYQLKPQYRGSDLLKYNNTAAAEELAKWRAGIPSIMDDKASAYVFANWEQVAGKSEADRLVALARSVAAASDRSSTTGKPGLTSKLTLLTSPSVPQVEIIFSDGFAGGYLSPSDPLYSQVPKPHFFTLLVAIQHPLSTGSVHINTSFPLTGNPVINPNYLSNEYDMASCIAALKFARRIALSDPLRSVWENEYSPALDAVKTDDDDEAWRRAKYFPSDQHGGDATEKAGRGGG